MNTQQLALFGGQPAVSRTLEAFRSVGEDEVAVAAAVIRTGVLSAYIGAPGEAFMGGKRVRSWRRRRRSTLEAGTRWR